MATNVDPLLIQTINQILQDGCEPDRVMRAELEHGGFDAELWSTLENAGLTLVGVPEALGGSGGTLHDAAAIIKAAGYHAAPVPLADSLTAAGLAAAAGLSVPSGPIVALADPGSGTLVPWAPSAGFFLVSLTPSDEGDLPGIALVAKSAASLTASSANYAGEPRAAVLIDGIASLVKETDIVSPATLAGDLALSRSLLMAGALHRAVDLSVQYAQDRQQFGKPIGKQQAIQHYLSQMAGEAYAAEAAADNAVDAVAAGGPANEHLQSIAAAKAVTGRAVAMIARLAHQIHGAIGFTDEHRLQLTTRRLWAWRDEHGTEAQWAAHLGRELVAAGGPALWPKLTNWPPAG